MANIFLETKITKIFCENIKVLLFEDGNIKNQYLEITALTKSEGIYVKKLD
jgi:hypothetical protein